MPLIAKLASITTPSAVVQFVANIYYRLSGRRRPVHPIDHALGIETSQRVATAALKGGSSDTIGYVGSTPSIIRKCLDLIDVDPRADFVDLGCGKGRVLIVAAEYPFRRLTGIEHSSFVCAAARQNITKLRPRSRYADRISVVQGDASKPTLPDSSSVIVFMYHPFRRPLVEVLRKQLESEVAKAPNRNLWLIYYNPVCFELFDESPSFARFFAARMDFEVDEAAAAPTGNTYDSVIIYQAISGPQRPPLAGASAEVKVTIPGLAVEVIDADESPG